MGLRVYNTIKNKIEDFEPLNDNKVRMYVCGTTDYDYIHLGHARTYIAYDMMVRYLEWKGYDVLYVQNITDVGHLTDEGEDKIEKKADEEKIHPMQIVEYYMRKHLENVDDLKIKRPDIMPRATGHLIDMIEAIKELIRKGYAYEANGSVYFDISKLDDYGKLSNVDSSGLEGTDRIQNEDEKKDPKDFALWKDADEDQMMKWPSPWGLGFPGWHIECSVMSQKYLGEKFDIHGGAIELAFPHHENEIAQSKGLCGIDPVKYWLHTGLLNVDGEKMSKSEGNYITVEEALQNHNPEVIRLWILSSHYRSPVDYTTEKIEEVKKNLETILTFIARLRKKESSNLKKPKKGTLSERTDQMIKKFEQRMDKDFNSPEALSEIYQFINEANRILDLGDYERGDLEYARKKIEEILEIFGILPQTPRLHKIVPDLLEIRSELRESEEYELADKIRDILQKAGVSVEDIEDETIWRKKL